MQTPQQTIDGESERAVSPVIGVILMVAVTVILAAVIGTFVLELGSNVEEKAPSVAASFSDSDAAFDSTAEYNAVRINLDRLDSDIEMSNIRIRVTNPDTGNELAVLDDDGSFTDGNVELNLNGAVPGSTTVAETGDTFVISDNVGGAGAVLSDDTEYKVQIIYLGNEQKIVASSTVKVT